MSGEHRKTEFVFPKEEAKPPFLGKEMMEWEKRGNYYFIGFYSFIQPMTSLTFIINFHLALGKSGGEQSL